MVGRGEATQFELRKSRHVQSAGHNRPSLRPKSAMTACSVHTDVHGSVLIDWDLITGAGGSPQEDFSPRSRFLSGPRGEAESFQIRKIRLQSTIDRLCQDAFELQQQGCGGQAADAQINRTEIHRSNNSTRPTGQRTRSGHHAKRHDHTAFRPTARGPLPQPPIRQPLPVMADHSFPSVRQRQQREHLEADRRTIHKVIRERRPSSGTKELKRALEGLARQQEVEHMAAQSLQETTALDMQVRLFTKPFILPQVTVKFTPGTYRRLHARLLLY